MAASQRHSYSQYVCWLVKRRMQGITEGKVCTERVCLTEARIQRGNFVSFQKVTGPGLSTLQPRETSVMGRMCFWAVYWFPCGNIWDRMQKNIQSNACPLKLNPNWKNGATITNLKDIAAEHVAFDDTSSLWPLQGNIADHHGTNWEGPNWRHFCQYWSLDIPIQKIVVMHHESKSLYSSTPDPEHLFGFPTSMESSNFAPHFQNRQRPHWPTQLHHLEQLPVHDPGVHD